VEDPVQPTQQASESSEADVTHEADERIAPEGEGETEVADIETAQEMADSEVSEEEAEIPEEAEILEAPEEEEETDGEEEVQPEEEVLDPELAHNNEQYEGKEVYPGMFTPSQPTDYTKFDRFFDPSYEEIQRAMQNPAEPQAIDPLENSEPTEEAMPILDTLEASNQATTWISEAQEDEEPSIQVDPSLLRF
jgi:hypothetical protein